MSEVKIFTHPLFRQNCTEAMAKSLVQRFTAYKKHVKLQNTFGREEKYTKPEWVKDCNLWHIHVKDASSGGWPKKILPNLDVFRLTSDSALIYTRGDQQPDYYLLINFVTNAHSLYGGTEKFVRDMARIAEGFRNVY